MNMPSWPTTKSPVIVINGQELTEEQARLVQQAMMDFATVVSQEIAARKRPHPALQQQNELLRDIGRMMGNIDLATGRKS